MLDNVSDLVLGVSFFVTFIVLSIVAGGLLERRRRSRNLRALGSLSGLIEDATLDGDSHSVRLVGHYQGRPVWIELTPGKDMSHSSEYSIRINALEILLRDVPGRHDWSIRQVGMLRKSWQPQAPEGVLSDRLAATDLVTALSGLGRYALLAYDARRAQLRLQLEVPRLPPCRSLVRNQLELARHAVEVNRALNTGES